MDTDSESEIDLSFPFLVWNLYCSRKHKISAIPVGW